MFGGRVVLGTSCVVSVCWSFLCCEKCFLYVGHCLSLDGWSPWQCLQVGVCEHVCVLCILWQFAQCCLSVHCALVCVSEKHFEHCCICGLGVGMVSRYVLSEIMM